MGQATFTTAGAHTWTCPAGVTSVKVECWGGGAACSNGGGQGGGGGGYASSNISVTPNTTYNIGVGAGGGSLGAAGGDSTWQTNVVIGAGGQVPGGGGISPINIGDITHTGGNGFNGSSSAGGGGSAFPNANGGNGLTNAGGVGYGNGGGPSQNGFAPGGGGGYNTGLGATGQVVLTWNASGVGGDPHFIGFDGSYFEFHGVPNACYTLYQDKLVTVNARFVKMKTWRKFETYIGEVGIVYDNTKIRITNNPHDRSALPLFAEHKTGIMPANKKIIPLNGDELRKHTKITHAHQFMPSALSFINGNTYDACVVPLAHGNVVVMYMEQRGAKFLNVVFNVKDKKAHGIIGQTVRKRRIDLNNFQVDNLFQKWKGAVPI